jgi:hypothetical protein
LFSNCQTSCCTCSRGCGSSSPRSSRPGRPCSRRSSHHTHRGTSGCGCCTFCLNRRARGPSSSGIVDWLIALERLELQQFHTRFLRSQIAELKLTVDGLEKERDFYFNKLRDVEVRLAFPISFVAVRYHFKALCIFSRNPPTASSVFP